MNGFELEKGIITVIEINSELDDEWRETVKGRGKKLDEDDVGRIMIKIVICLYLFICDFRFSFYINAFTLFLSM